MLSGGTAMNVGMGIEGNLIIFAYVTFLWPFIIFWKIETSGIIWFDFLVIGIFLVLLILILKNLRHKKNIENMEIREHKYD